MVEPSDLPSAHVTVFWSAMTGIAPLLVGVARRVHGFPGPLPAVPEKAKAFRLESHTGFTPRIRGVWARLRFRQLASSPSLTRNWMNDTPPNAPLSTEAA